MNTRIEAAIMISAGALLAASAQVAPTIGERVFQALQTPAEAALVEPAAAFPNWLASTGGHEPADGYILALCQDAPNAVRSNNATINTRGDDGGFTVSIKDGELVKVEADGAYTLEEEGDTVRILDADGDIAFETSKSNPSIGTSGLDLRFFGSSFPGQAPAAPRLERAALGIGSTTLEPAMAAQLGVDQGVVIEFVEPGSGADAGGLQQYDVLVAIDGQPVDARSLTAIIGSHEPGDTVVAEVIRKGERESLEIALGSASFAPPVAPMPGIAPDPFPEFEAMQRRIEAQMRELDRLMDAHGHPALTPRLAPSPVLRPAPNPAPNADKNPDAVDASQMAPRSKGRGVPA